MRYVLFDSDGSVPKGSVLRHAVYFFWQQRIRFRGWIHKSFQIRLILFDSNESIFKDSIAIDL